MKTRGTKALLIEKQESLTILYSDLRCAKNTIDKFQLTPEDWENDFNTHLDESYQDEETIVIKGYSYRPSTVFKAVDPVTYRVELGHFVDDIPLERDDRYKELLEAVENIEDEINYTKDNIEELKAKLKTE